MMYFMSKFFTFVLIILNCLVEKVGCSPAPARATKDVQNNISTIPVPLSAIIYCYYYLKYKYKINICF